MIRRSRERAIDWRSALARELLRFSVIGVAALAVGALGLGGYLGGSRWVGILGIVGGAIFLQLAWRGFLIARRGEHRSDVDLAENRTGEGSAAGWSATTAYSAICLGVGPALTTGAIYSAVHYGRADQWLQAGVSVAAALFFAMWPVSYLRRRIVRRHSDEA
jgi:hypothetical protein